MIKHRSFRDPMLNSDNKVKIPSLGFPKVLGSFVTNAACHKGHSWLPEHIRFTELTLSTSPAIFASCYI